jgi:hypothetical protein
MVIFLLKCLGITAILLLAITLGRRIGLRAKERTPSAEKQTLSTAVGAMMVLMSFMLAITYSLTSARFTDRKQLLLDDVNAISTLDLRSGFLSRASRDESRSLIREYVDLRARKTVRAPEIKIKELQAATDRWEAIHQQLWNLATRDQQLLSDPAGRKLYFEALNTMIDVHTSRYNTEYILRAPSPIWILLASVVTLAMISLGVETGLSEIHSRAVILVVLLLTITLSSLLLFLHEVDNPESDVISITQQPMIKLYESLTATADKN